MSLAHNYGNPVIGVSKFFYDERTLAKYQGRRGEIGLDVCNKCLVIFDGKTCGGYMKLGEAKKLTAQDICRALEGAEDLGPLNGIEVAEDLCAVVSQSATIGEVVLDGVTVS